QAVGVDSWEVMDIFCQDTKLNISSYYMKPGFAFGGSCLPKDVRALTFKGRDLDLDLPLLNALIPTNEAQVARAVEMVAEIGIRNIAFLGISFKSGTDDLRESPQVTLVERLIGKGFNLRIYDKNVHLARLLGANRAFIESVIPHIGEILSDDMDAELAHGDLVIVGNPAPEFRLLADRLGPQHRVLDLARIPASRPISESGIVASTGEALPGVGRRVLIVVENLPVPFDRRVWAEATSLAQHGYTVSVISPKGKGLEADYELLDGVHVYRHDL